MFFRLKQNTLLMSVITISLLFSGCASTNYGQQQTTVSYYPQCYAPIQELRKADSNFNTTVATSTAVGAGLGILAGLLITGSVEGAIIGGVSGAASGALIGYGQAKRNRIQDDNLRMASYLNDIDGDISGLNRATGAARISRQCYDNAFRVALASYNDKKISKVEFRAKLNEIKNGSAETAMILGQIITGASEKEKAYQEAITAEAKLAKVPVPASVVQAQNQQKYVAKASTKQAATKKDDAVSKKPAAKQTAKVTKPSPAKKIVAQKTIAKKTVAKKTTPATKAAKPSPAKKTVTQKTVAQKTASAETSSATIKPVSAQIESMASNTTLLVASRQEASDEQLKLQNLNQEMMASLNRLDS